MNDRLLEYPLKDQRLDSNHFFILKKKGKERKNHLLKNKNTE